MEEKFERSLHDNYVNNVLQKKTKVYDALQTLFGPNLKSKQIENLIYYLINRTWVDLRTDEELKTQKENLNKLMNLMKGDKKGIEDLFKYLIDATKEISKS